MPNKPQDGKPGTTDQSPRWEGPAENRPRGYLPAEDDPYNEKDAAGETLKHPDRQTLSDAFATKDNAPPPRASVKQDRDVVKDYPLPEFIDKLRRLADALENGSRFQIDIAGERINVPMRARYNIEHERSDDEEEIEFQITWSHRSD